MFFSTVALWALIAPATNGAVFMQCSSPEIQPNLLSGVVNAVTTTLSPAAEFNGCRQYCVEKNMVFSIYQPGLAGLLASCFCAALEPEAEYVTKAKDPAGNCLPGSYAVSYLPSAPWSFTSCATGSTVSGGPPPFESYQNSKCFKDCAAYKHMSMVSTEDGSYMCTCGNTLVAGTPATCDRGVAQLYTTGATASGVARRNKIAREAARRNAKRTLCPDFQTACIIPGTDSFECLDTGMELTSCGGCSDGVFDPPLDAEFTAGVDCTALPGVAAGAVSCESGQCVIWDCASDYALVDGACVALGA
ncbi:delayed-type hypersensitivity antigen - related protein [Trichosporon asahii var. asahii CBS 2479]|uniref:Delayed-type hypersensitivity antigen-related protein n=1 Tax=Trichosporon asahii var. asahii (strain ATCC 90039 / CBS 2479 / JCM 2466 / KCTC 7840 / NBRC 103889/ NCYC 2677 / UAMH 7654) TaxID=1186058 RepID=J4UDD2_TRIAS|nr:delayed-type hypersensitivity antigen - related protein [Trichosporon asahii var. asahii CBS 2479]EJT49120.1 delayed-type hypersensitivity antigen - related protein [Trichosporon asahii var. asahii CBS 2479]